MRLVLFRDAMAHICRVSRVIRQPQGNALCLGMGGTGMLGGGVEANMRGLVDTM